MSPTKSKKIEYVYAGLADSGGYAFGHLSDRVNELLKAGWQLYGPTIVTPIELRQPMILPLEDGESIATTIEVLVITPEQKSIINECARNFVDHGEFYTDDLMHKHQVERREVINLCESGLVLDEIRRIRRSRIKQKDSQ